jgi:hypothetical protein
LSCAIARDVVADKAATASKVVFIKVSVDGPQFFQVEFCLHRSALHPNLFKFENLKLDMLLLNYHALRRLVEGGFGKNVMNLILSY